VIVTCERCETEFQLDDARVPASGARVRCSRCKHAFFVLPPTASRDQVIEQAASAALTGDSTPEVAEDLPPPDVGHASSASGHADGEDSESDWQFNADLPADAGDSSPNLQASGFARVPTQPDDSESDTDSATRLELASDRKPEGPPQSQSDPWDLGSPVDWNFFEKPPEHAAPAVAAAQESAPALVISVDTSPDTRRPSNFPLILRRAVDAVGWIAVAALCAVALVRGLAPPAPVATDWPAPAPGLALENVRGRWLDNASLGRLYVVSGRVMNRASDPAALPPLALELRDASGRALGAPIPLRGPSAPGQLREASSAGLATAGSDLPGGLAPGVSWDFEVVAWPLPAQAARFAIRARS
jgi:predicted Zn finger-like uncharacterized protein